MKLKTYIIQCQVCSQQYLRISTGSIISKCQKKGCPMWCNDCGRYVRGKFVKIVEEII